MTDLRPTLVELTIADPPEAWEAAGFAVAPDGTCTLGTVTLRFAPAEGRKGISGWSLFGVEGVEEPDGDGTLDGIPTTVVEPPEPLPQAPTHRIGATTIDHVVVLSPDLERTVAALTAAGLDERRRRHTDSYGFPATQVFFRLGEPILELIGLAEPDPATADRPSSFFGLALTVDDLDAAVATLGDHAGSVKDAVQPGRRITTLRHKALGISVPVALMSR